jgi:hypothetical protein
MSPEKLERLRREAQLIASRTPYKQLAEETGYNVKYISNVISKEVRKLKDKVAITSSTEHAE